MRFGHFVSALMALVLTMVAFVASMVASVVTSIMELLVVWCASHLKLFIIIIIVIIFVIEIVTETAWWPESVWMWLIFLLTHIFFGWLLVVEWLSEWLEVRVFSASLWLLALWWHFQRNCSLIVELLSHLLNGVSGVLGGIVLLNVVILLVKVLVDQAVHEVFSVDDGNESNEAHEGSDLADLSLQFFHALGASLGHRDALGDASLCIPVLFQDWSEDSVGRSAHPDGETATNDLKHGEDKHGVGVDLEIHVLPINVWVGDGEVSAHENDLN
jgi:hypothetical protein